MWRLTWALHQKSFKYVTAMAKQFLPYGLPTALANASCITPLCILLGMDNHFRAKASNLCVIHGMGYRFPATVMDFTLFVFCAIHESFPLSKESGPASWRLILEAYWLFPVAGAGSPGATREERGISNRWTSGGTHARVRPP